MNGANEVRPPASPAAGRCVNCREWADREHGIIVGSWETQSGPGGWLVAHRTCPRGIQRLAQVAEARKRAAG